MLTVNVTGLELDCRIGINPGEQDSPQPIVIDLSVEVSAAGGADGHAAGDPAVDYAELAARVEERATSRPFGLIEELARECGMMIRATFPAAGRIHVRVAKPAALSGCGVPSVDCVLEKATEYGA